MTQRDQIIFLQGMLYGNLVTEAQVDTLSRSHELRMFWNISDQDYHTIGEECRNEIKGIYLK